MTFNEINFLIYLALVCVFGSIWLLILFSLRKKRNKSFAYIMGFSIFYVYLVKVLDYTLFQFQSLIIVKIFVPHLTLRGISEGNNINLIPLLTLTAADLKTSLLNILLFVPFGIGLPFLTEWSFKKVVGLGLVFSISIELLQLVTGLLAKTTFRITDINDVIFNTTGAVIGYLLYARINCYFNCTKGSH